MAHWCPHLHASCRYHIGCSKIQPKWSCQSKRNKALIHIMKRERFKVLNAEPKQLNFISCGWGNTHNSSIVCEVFNNIKYYFACDTISMVEHSNFQKAVVVKMKVCARVHALVWQSRWIPLPGPICAVGRLTIWRTLRSLKPIIVAPNNPGIIRSFARSSQIIKQ